MASGDTCPMCGHYLKVLNTIVSERDERRIMYLGCAKCGHRPEDNKVIVPLKYAPPRRKRPREEQAVA